MGEQKCVQIPDSAVEEALVWILSRQHTVWGPGTEPEAKPMGNCGLQSEFPVKSETTGPSQNHRTGAS